MELLILERRFRSQSTSLRRPKVEDGSKAGVELEQTPSGTQRQEVITVKRVLSRDDSIAGLI